MKLTPNQQRYMETFKLWDWNRIQLEELEDKTKTKADRDYIKRNIIDSLKNMEYPKGIVRELTKYIRQL